MLEHVIVGIPGGGLGLVTTLPEVLKEPRRRQGVLYKRGDVLVHIDILREIPPPEGDDGIDHRFYIKGNLLGKQIHVAKLVLPINFDPPRIRSATIPHVILSADNQRVDGYNVIRIEREGVETLREIEAELLSHV